MVASVVVVVVVVVVVAVNGRRRVATRNGRRDGLAVVDEDRGVTDDVAVDNMFE